MPDPVKPDPVKPVPMPGVGTPGGHPGAPSPADAAAADLTKTIPGGIYLVPGTKDKFINAAGEPIDKDGKRLAEDK